MTDRGYGGGISGGGKETSKVSITEVFKAFTILFVLLFDALFKPVSTVFAVLFFYFNAVLYMKGKTFSQLEIQPFINIDAA